MAHVVGLAAVVGDEVHEVVAVDELWELRGEVLDGAPEGPDGGLVLADGEDEAVLLVVDLHELEEVVLDVAEQRDVVVDSPVVLVLVEELALPEEAGLVAAHVSVRDGSAVRDVLLSEGLAGLVELVHVDEVRDGPVLLWDQAVLSLTGHKRAGDLLELLGEGLVVQKDPVVVVPVVEPVLDVSDGLDELPEV